MASVRVRSSEENKEIVTLIWFDSATDQNQDTTNTMKTLRTINDYVLIYNNVEECLQYINSVTREKIFFVIPEAWTPVLLPLIIHLKQIELIFIFCTSREQHLNLMKKYPKISGVFTDRKELETNVRKNLHLINNQVETFSFYDQKQNVSMTLSERAAEFLWFQLCHDVILQLPSNSEAKQQMIRVCRDYYRDNDKEIQSIDQFEKFYTSKTCIQWYTRESFVYKMINKALRTEDIQQLYTFRFFISDLSSALAREHEKIKMDESEDGRKMTVYRGVRLSLNELEQFRSNEGKLIAINGYLSTSRIRKIAVKFAVNDIKRADSVPVLFEIECCRKDSDWPIFADIATFSGFPDEQEVLFDLAAVFKVETVSEEDDLWKICLTATDDGREIAKQYIEETKKEMQGDSVVILFGSLLTRMGQYERAQTYFQHLLKEPGNENLAHIHNQLGLVYQAKAEYDQAMGYFETAYQLTRESSLPLLRDSAHILRNMSHVWLEQGYYEKALEYSSKAEQILKESNDSCELELAQCVDSIGSTYQGLQKYSEALTFYEEALNIKRSCLPENHVHIAKSFNSIGLIYLMTKDVEKAFNFYLSSLEMYQTCLPEDHPDIANALHNIAECFQHRKQYDKALQHYQLALTMKEKCLPSKHPSIAATLNNMSTVFSAKVEREQALKLCLKALEMRQRMLPVHHPDLAVSLSSAGHKYEAIGDYGSALKYFEKALKIRETFLSKDHPVRKRTERHVIRMKRKVS